MTYQQINGSMLFTERCGTGEPVLLLHGGFCSLESLRPLGEALPPGHAVFAFERAGHGRSADSDGEYSYEQGVADVLAYLAAEGLSSVHIIGYSDGAILGLLLARDHPQRVRSLVAISANLDPSAFSQAPEATGQLQLSRLPRDEAGPPDPERAHYERLSPDGPAHADVVLAKLLRLWTRAPQIAPASLATITAPTLIISGDRDSIRVDHSLLIAAAIPAAQLCIVPGATHGLVNDRRPFLHHVLAEFLPSPATAGSGATAR